MTDDWLHAATPYFKEKITKRSNTVSGIRDRWNVRRCMKDNRSTVLTFTFAVTQWRFDKLVQRCAWNVNHHHQHNEREDAAPKKLAVMPRCTPLVYFLSPHVKFTTHYFHTLKAQVYQHTTVTLMYKFTLFFKLISM